MSSSLSKKIALPQIAIIGRPNVGKSTLFNRLLGSRRAITDPTPGVTRDPVEGQCLIGDLACMIVDTGGYSTEKEVFNAQVAEKAMSMAGRADLILLIVDVHVLDSDDYTFMELVRRFTPKMILVINKVDTPEKEALCWEYHQFGFRKVIHISAAHGRNMDDLQAAISEFFVNFVPGEAAPAQPEMIRVAIMGKPNTGKSTLTNLLLGEDKSIVSDIPGTTRDVVEGLFTFEGKTIQLMDTAGIRRKKKVIDPVEYYSVNRAIGTIHECDVILLLVDAREGISEQDKKIAQLAAEKGRGIILLLSKWDLIEDLPNRLEAITDRTRFLFPIVGFAPVLPLSALENIGIKKILKTVVLVRNQLYKRVETAQLNSLLQTWLAAYPLRDKGKSVKVLYATQVNVCPVKFIFFVSRVKGVRREYITYLKNKIKTDLGFDKIPFSLELREHKQTKN